MPLAFGRPALAAGMLATAQAYLEARTGALGTVYKLAAQRADGNTLDTVVGPLEIPGVLRASSVLIYPSTMVA